MDSYHTLHLPSMLPGMILSLVFKEELEWSEDATKSLIKFHFPLLVGNADSLVWYHVVRLSRSFLLDESDFGIK